MPRLAIQSSGLSKATAPALRRSEFPGSQFPDVGVCSRRPIPGRCETLRSTSPSLKEAVCAARLLFQQSVNTNHKTTGTNRVCPGSRNSGQAAPQSGERN